MSILSWKHFQERRLITEYINLRCRTMEDIICASKLYMVLSCDTSHNLFTTILLRNIPGSGYCYKLISFQQKLSENIVISHSCLCRWLNVFIWDPFYLHWQTWTTAGISNNMPSKVRDEITYSFLKFNSAPLIFRNKLIISTQTL